MSKPKLCSSSLLRVTRRPICLLWDFPESADDKLLLVALYCALFLVPFFFIINFQPLSPEQLSGRPLCAWLHLGPLFLYLTPSPTLRPSICHISPLAGSRGFICSCWYDSLGVFRFLCSGCHLPHSSSSSPAPFLVESEEACIMHPCSSGRESFCSQSTLALLFCSQRSSL